MPVPKKRSNATDEELLQAVQDEHNACFIQVEDWAGWGLQTCRPVAMGEQILVHYGKGSAHRVREVWDEQAHKKSTVR